MTQAIRSVRPSGLVRVLGVPHDVEIPAPLIFRGNVGINGGPASIPTSLPQLLAVVLGRQIESGLVFALELPLEQALDAYAAIDGRRAITALLWA